MWAGSYGVKCDPNQYAENFVVFDADGLYSIQMKYKAPVNGDYGKFEA